MMEENLQEKIDRFLRRRLSKEDAETFQKEIDNNPKLKEEVDSHQLALNAVGLLIKDNVFSMLKEVKLEDPKQDTRIFSIRRIFSYAASFLLFLFLGLSWFAHHNYSTKKIVSSEYISMLDPSVAGANPSVDISKVFHNEKDYQKTIDLFDQMEVSQSMQYVTAQTYAAHSFFQLKQFEKAEQLFKATINSNMIPSNTTLNELKWNLLLSQVGAGKIPEGLDAILANSSHPSHQRAIALNEKLNSSWRTLVFW